MTLSRQFNRYTMFWDSCYARKTLVLAKMYAQLCFFGMFQNISVIVVTFNYGLHFSVCSLYRLHTFLIYEYPQAHPIICVQPYIVVT